jgi:hypothetical protein
VDEVAVLARELELGRGGGVRVDSEEEGRAAEAWGWVGGEGERGEQRANVVAAHGQRRGEGSGGRGAARTEDGGGR